MSETIPPSGYRSPSEAREAEVAEFWRRYERPCGCEPAELREEADGLECVHCARKVRKGKR